MLSPAQRITNLEISDEPSLLPRCRWMLAKNRFAIRPALDGNLSALAANAGGVDGDCRFPSRSQRRALLPISGVMPGDETHQLNIRRSSLRRLDRDEIARDLIHLDRQITIGQRIG